MKITEATVLPDREAGVHILIDGASAIITLTKKSLLDLGIAVVEDAEGAEPFWTHVSFILPGDPIVGRVPTEIQGGTTHPVLVCLARRYFRSCNEEDFWFAVNIPTQEEALAELADSRAWKKGI